MKDHVVYIAYDADGKVLYVGMSSNLGGRLATHRHSANWWPLVNRVEVEHLPSRGEAFHRESKLIAELKPAHNLHPGAVWDHPRPTRNPRPTPQRHGKAGRWDAQVIRLRKQGKSRAEIEVITGLSWQQLATVVRRLLAEGKIQRTPGNAAYHRRPGHDCAVCKAWAERGRSATL